MYALFISWVITQTFYLSPCVAHLDSNLQQFGVTNLNQLPHLGETFPTVLQILRSILRQTRRGSPIDRRPSTAEAPPRGKIHPFSKMTVTFDPVIGF